MTVDDIAPLARGGMAEVFSGRLRGTGVVVKVPRDDRSGADDALIREAGVLVAVGPPIAPRLLGRTRLDGRDGIVLEHVALPTLRSVRPAIRDPIATAIAIARAVARIHAAGFVHADLSPDNILLDPSTGEVRVVDFGLATAVGRPLSPHATIGFAAPERHADAALADPAIDVYALGVICYELVVGEPPFAGGVTTTRLGHVARRVPRIADRVAVPSGIDDAVARAMAKAPAMRPRDAAALVDDLERALATPIRDVRSRAVPAAPSSRRAVLVGFASRARAGTVRDAIDAAGGVLAFVHGSRYVAVAASDDDGRRLVVALAAATATDVDVVDAEVRWSPDGIPFGVAIVELARREPRRVCGTSSPPAPLIGRDDALAAVVAALDGRGSRLVTVWGTPGIGKSRLAAAVVDRLESAGDAALVLRAPTIGDVVDLVGADIADVPVERAALDVALGRGGVTGSAAESLAVAPGALRRACARALARRLASRAAPIVVDDAHAADPAVLDAIELATLDPHGPVVVVLARPELRATRARWGLRAADGRVVDLEPLDHRHGRELVRALLPPLSAVPGAAIDRIVERCGGVPLLITETVAALLRSRGAGPATRGALATDALDIPARDVVGWAVREQLAGLSSDAVAVAELIAILGRGVTADDVRRLVDIAETIQIEVDPDIAIAELFSIGIVVGVEAALQFRHDLVREAIAARLDDAHRVAIHRAALAALAMSPSDRARHLEGAGDRAAAEIAWRDVARAAIRRHDDLGAEHAATRAIACADGRDAELLRLRGNARARLGRHDAAADDFAVARAAADAAGRRGIAIDALLDHATALDWALHYDAAARCTDEAFALADPDEPPLRDARLAMARGRAAWRAGNAERAIPAWWRAIELADGCGDDGYETAIACRLMLGFVLGGRGDIDVAATILDRALADATARGDLLHAAFARGNRYPIQAARGDLDGLRDDLAVLAAAGRELGMAVTEYRGALYQALVALWCADDAVALDHATAAYRLENADPELFPRPRATLVLGELHARAGDRAEVARWVDSARARPAAIAIDRVMLDALGAWLDGCLDVDRATAFARRAIALDEDEAAFQLLELAARTVDRAGDAVAASVARRAARALPAKLPRFIR